MKKIIFILFVAYFIIGCTADNELNTILYPTDNVVFNASLEEVPSDTRTYFDNQLRMYWNRGDLLTVFNTTLNKKYKFRGDDGDTGGYFDYVRNPDPDVMGSGAQLTVDANFAIYPYDEKAQISYDGVITTYLPNTLSYRENSFGKDSNPMVAVTQSQEDTEFKFKNLYSYMMFQLYGEGVTIKSIKFEGNDDEKISGKAYITAEYGQIPLLTFANDATESITLDCGTEGVALGATADEAKEFWVVVPPMTYSKGFTLTITDINGGVMTKSTSKSYVATRNEMRPINAFKVETSNATTPETGHNTEPYFSETVELMGLIFRLAGVEEYNGCNVETIAKSADEYFASMKNHQAVELAKQYRRTNVAFDAVTGYGCQLIFNDKGEIIFDPDYQEGSNPSFDRWTDQQKNDMLAAANDFYKTSNFHSWFISTQSEQQKAITSFKTVANVDYTWFDSFYGKNDKLASRVILSFMIGGHNNGISLKRKDGTLLLTPVMGSLRQQNETISYNGGIGTIIHEFSHPYCNPLIEANWSDISTKANEVYSKVSDLMTTGQAYGSAMSMMYETLVRASVIRYMISHNMEDKVNQQLIAEENNGFMMVRTLVKTLEKREQEAANYPTLASFMSEIIKAINAFDPNETPTAEPDTLPKDYVDLGIVADDGRRLYFATRNVGETSPAGFGTNTYRWGATIEGGAAWNPPTGEIWPNGKKLDAAHDIATITWGEKWHTPSVDEWNLLVGKCDYERKEANESGYGVAGYFFYNKADHSKFIFLPVSPSINELNYWTSEISNYENNGTTYCCARCFRSYLDDNKMVACGATTGLDFTGCAIRPVFVEQGPVPEPEPEPEPEYPTEVGHNTEPYFSETVELMGLIWRLAGAEDFNRCQVSTVANSADSYFASVKNHQAVQLAKQDIQLGGNADQWGIHFILNEEGEIIIDLNEKEKNYGFPSWTNQRKNDMLVAVNDFYKTSNFHEWFVSTKSEREQAIASFKSVVKFDYTWFDSYYGNWVDTDSGKTDKLASRIILSFMTGTTGYGCSIIRKDGTLLLTPIIGSFSQENGIVRYNNDVNHLVHEFSHPFWLTPIGGNNWSSISSKADEVFSKVVDAMAKLGCPNALTMMNETLVRASTIRYMISHNMEDKVNQQLIAEENNGFIMVKTLVKTLEKREQEADKYPTMVDFMPELIKAINEFDPDKAPTAEPDTLPKDYVDLGIEMGDGKKLYFATRNVGETSPAGFGTNVYRWGATIEGGAAWAPDSGIWPTGTTLDAAHDIATITWGEKWHTPSIDEWTQLAEQCDYERKEANESGYGVAGYFFYNKADHSKFIFLPVSSNNELAYWTSQTNNYTWEGTEYCQVQIFNSYGGSAMCGTTADPNATYVAVRPVFVE